MKMCEKCKSNNLIETENGHYCCNCGWDSVKKDYIKRMTNADRIRKMNDEELADFLGEFEVCDVCKYLGDRGECELDSIFLCEKGFAVAIAKNWLQSEVKGSE